MGLFDRFKHPKTHARSSPESFSNVSMQDTESIPESSIPDQEHPDPLHDPSPLSLFYVPHHSQSSVPSTSSGSTGSYSLARLGEPPAALSPCGPAQGHTRADQHAPCPPPRGPRRQSRAAEYLQQRARDSGAPADASPGGSEGAQAADLSVLCIQENRQKQLRHVPPNPAFAAQDRFAEAGSTSWCKIRPAVRRHPLLSIRSEVRNEVEDPTDAHSQTRKNKVWRSMLSPEQAHERMTRELLLRPNVFAPPRDWRHGVTNRPQWRRHRALIISVRYRWTRQMQELQGTNSDMREIFRVLHDRLGFKLENIRVLCEGELGVAGPEAEGRVAQPTKKNIMDGLSWVVEGMRKGDSGFFFYAGHGEETRDVSGDEISGFDQVIIPSDFAKAGHLKDDDIHRLMVRCVPKGARLTAVVDACHAGSVLDLPVEYWYRETVKEYTPNTVKETEDSHDSRARLTLWSEAPSCRLPRVHEIGDVVLFSGSSDMQRAADAPIDSRNTWMGAFTYSFLGQVNKLYPSVLHRECCFGPRHSLTFGEVLDNVKQGVRDHLVRHFPRVDLTNLQIPQMSSSYAFDPYATPFGI